MNVILFGMPLSGKTTIARIVAKDLGVHWYDLDAIIEDIYNESVSNIYINLNEDKFREIESKCLENIDCNHDHVLSIGGGAANFRNSKMIKAYDKRVWLKCSDKEIIARHDASKSKRPLLYNTNNIKETLKVTYRSRVKQFQALSNFQIDTTNLDIPDTVQHIIKSMNEIN